MTERDHNLLAGEYALGTLGAQERTEAERLIASDPAFARAVSEWETRLALLSEAEEPVAPPASVWAGIEAGLDAAAQTGVTPIAALARQLADLKRSLSAWRFVAVSSAMATVALALVWLGGLQSPLQPQAPEERYVAMLQNDAGETGFVITMEMPGKQFAIRPVAAKAPESKSYELWCIIKGSDKPPVTMGLVGTEAYAMMDAPWQLDREELEQGVELAISLEPEGGAPSGRSMGPIVFAGLLMKQTP